MTIFNGLLVNTAGLWGQRIVGLIGAHRHSLAIALFRKAFSYD